jgi:N-acetylmuramoyl-L-alanine amidase
VTNRVIVIDPGHGGDNPGARSQTTGRHEKDLTLDWALRLRPLLEAKGWTVFLTRTNDASMSLAERVEFADRHNAELFVSLHFNSLPRISQGGLETYCLTPAGMSSHLIREEVDLPELTWPNNQHDAFNLQLATRIHQELVRTTGRSDRGVRRARFMGVLKTQNRPAVLLEGGYLSNPEEAQLIAQPAFRQKLAEAVANALN